MICKYCGNQLADGTRYCINCGALNDAENTASAQGNVPSNFPGTFTATKKKKTQISDTKTPFFWISKAILVAALVCFLLPFMKINFGSGALFKDANTSLTGRELVFGADDADSGSKLTNYKVIISAVLAIAAIIMNKKCSAIPAALSAIFTFAFISGAENDYTFLNKKISEWDGLITLDMQPGVYIVAVLFIAATVLAAIDFVKRKKMLESESQFY